MSIGLTMRAEDVRKLRPEPVPVVVKWPKPAAWFAWYGFGLGVVVGLALGHLLLPPL